MLRDEEEKRVIRLGSLVVYDTGQLLPHQMTTGMYNNTEYVYPVNFYSLVIHLNFNSMLQHLRTRAGN